MAVGSDQHGRGRSNFAEDRELPQASMRGIDEPDAIRPRSKVETAGFTEVEEHGPGVVQQREHARRTVDSLQIEVGHAPPEQRVRVTEVVVTGLDPEATRLVIESWTPERGLRRVDRD